MIFLLQLLPARLLVPFLDVIAEALRPQLVRCDETFVLPQAFPSNRVIKDLDWL